MACGPSPLQLERRFKIWDAEFVHVGHVTIVNRSGKVRALEVVEISPAYNPDDPQQPFWFGDVKKRELHLRPGAKLTLKPTFVGRKRATRSYDPRPWVDPGTYEGTMLLRDKTGGDELRFTMTIFAYKPD